MESQADREPLRRWDPEKIGPYAVLGRLGAGSMGQVYLGRSPAGRLVAVKTIRVELAEEAGFRTRFAQEVAAARKVSGVFTASVVEADPEADVPWLATAFVPAPSLSRMVLACGPLPVPAVRWLAAGCAEALGSIHSARLVHRDLKPSNVLVAPDGPRVIDFGVARAAERMEVTMSRGAVGTPAYMAPEQARDPHQASVASDVYSLGATLLYAATGHAPYQGASVMDVLARLATEEPDLSGLPDELTGLVTSCLERVPRNRPTSSAVLAQLGPFTEAQAGPAEEHAYLPAPAMALIGEYQRSPQAALAQASEERTADDPVDDATAASFTELPAAAAYKPLAQRHPEHGQPRLGQSRRPGPGRAGPRWRQWLSSHLAWAGWASVGAALIVVGVILGAALSSSSTPTPVASKGSQVNPAPPPTPPPPPDTECAEVTASKGPALCMERSYGDPNYTFSVQGSGFTPQASVAVALIWFSPPQEGTQTFRRVSAIKPVVASDGAFRFTVSRLFPDALRLGQFEVVVTAPGGKKVSTDFIVLPRGVSPG
jgi:serine/threonine protein kinase